MKDIKVYEYIKNYNTNIFQIYYFLYMHCIYVYCYIRCFNLRHTLNTARSEPEYILAFGDCS